MMQGAVEKRFKDTADAVHKLQARGAKVVFVRYPMSGELKAIEAKATPREGPWTRIINESGAPGYEFTVFWGIVAPAGTPAAIVKRLNAEFNAILSDPEAAKQLATEGAEVTPWTPAQFGVLLADNVAMWKRVARDADIRAE